MFINLSWHNFSESLDVALHEFKNIDHNVDDILNFCDEQLFSNKIICNIIWFKHYMKVKAFVREEEN